MGLATGRQPPGCCRGPRCCAALVVMVFGAVVSHAGFLFGQESRVALRRPSHCVPASPEACAAERKLRLLRLRGGSFIGDDIMEELEARERGPNSITSECYFSLTGASGRRTIHAGMLEALRDFADMPMCNQSVC